VNYKVVLICEL